MDVNIQKALNDKLYDKRKGGALELEGLIRESLAANDHDRIQKIVHQLCHDYAYAVHQPHARNGGLIGLAAASIALGSEVARYLEEIVPPVLACFSDQDARVRYYACESMYNIAKVAKGEILLYFNQVFDALCKLAADSELSVKNGAELLDRLIKDIVSESASSYVSSLHTPEDGGDESADDQTPPSVDAPTAFSLQRFIPLLQERINVINPFTRTFLVTWITLLDSIPDLELVSFLPSFLGGLFKFLSDPNQDVHTAAQTALDKFLSEIKKIARIKRGIAESRKSQGDDGMKHSTSSARSAPSVHSDDGCVHSDEEEPTSDQSGESVDSESMTANDEKSTSAEDDWIPGQDVQVDYAKILDILVTFLSDSSEEEVQLTALRWIDSFFEICPEDIMPFVPRLLSHVLPTMSHDVEQVRQAANRVNSSLMDYIMSLSDYPLRSKSAPPTQIQAPPASANATRETGNTGRRDSEFSNKTPRTTSRDPAAEVKAIEGRMPSGTRTPTPAEERAPSPRQAADLDYQAAVNALTLQFLNEHEATRVAAIAWLIMLHRKAPGKILSIDDGTFPALLKTLSDPSEAVVTRDLLLLSQISKNSEDSYFTSFMVNLLKLFCTDRRLLETRGNLIIRQLCVTLSAERIYRTMADCLEKDEDVEFASIMVQNLNNNLITAPELADLRKRLRNLETRDGQTFFVTLFKSWCHNAVATFSLCLLAQAYEQAYNLLLIFAELEMTVNMLIQIDKLVQLLESPVFTYLRLQLLEPEKFPHLYKCLYGLLMLLPQSSAFAALKNRLNSVSAIGYLHIAPRTYVPSSVSFFHSRQKSSESASSAQPAPGVSSFERPNRLKAREEGGIKWMELLDKFKSVQERARRPQRMATMGEEAATPVQETNRLQPPEVPPKNPRLNMVAGASRIPPVPQQGHQKAKSSLSNLGRFAGGVGARKTKR
ncbi:ARM repeat-containing protein [Lepidopterella palustris CBS 459.81]|uniref:ARM repeat-containing protein n=1 Tax=Lepidopterella palustris CBS 459.81 TaxID=1314670 RepID=A0A8E2ECA7_9PEZI|nr:ARM repeat-containing protein [Lepidopterella palustris CBS 459.81]